MRPSLAARLLSFAAPAAAGLVLGAAASAAPLGPVAGSCAAAGQNHAAIVVEHADGRVVTRCVGFSGTAVSAAQLLDASGLQVYTQAYGSLGLAICALDGEPAHYSSCLGTESYWVLFVSRGGGPWQASNAGISEVTLRSGDAEGFRYLPQTGSVAPPPSPAGVCAAAAATTKPSSRPAPPATPAAPGATSKPTSSPTGASPVAASATPSATESSAASPSPTRPPLAVAAASSASPGASGDATASSGDRTGLDAGVVVAGLALAGLVGLWIGRIVLRRRSGDPSP